MQKSDRALVGRAIMRVGAEVETEGRKESEDGICEEVGRVV